MRIERRGFERIDPQGWNGTEAAAVLQGVAMPEWYQGVAWRERGEPVIWRADELELMTSPSVGQSSLVLDDPGLPDAWWEAWNASLDALAAQRAPRLATPDTVTITQEQVTQTLTEAFPGLHRAWPTNQFLNQLEVAALPEKVTKEKVLVYVVRDGHLLVLRHTDYSYEEVGIQVPAGSVRPGETPEAAALREAREETGLPEFKIVRKLGETEYDISPYRFEIQHRHVFHLEVTEPTPERWMSQEDHDGEQEPTYFECFWIPLKAAHVLQSGQGALLGRLSD
ncbi:hypothetical protein Slala03_53570 [Streptomyces lavendulae subsp. lavendulae]|uniref:NUDIX hydrolase n=1 Tax=Streptomyces lavendulae TaxID=1914 RepID=UPI0024A4A4CF|nr:NUDIX domain-containing protein [Streptomyces lavendulae]GLV85668.1 hypothetical protein Slala03_53570 [Streptomyces lavendulae subsp. lavendulae]